MESDLRNLNFQILGTNLNAEIGHYRNFSAIIFQDKARNISSFGSTILPGHINKIAKSDLRGLNFRKILNVENCHFCNFLAIIFHNKEFECCIFNLMLNILIAF